MSDIAISVSNLSKCYKVFDSQRDRFLHMFWPSYKRGMQELWALKDVNFDIKRGEAVAIIGRNGGGKSTLLEILTGTLTPTTGNLKVNGRVSALLELGSGFNPEYSGRDNVILNGLLLGLSKAEILSRFNEIEAFAEIGTAIDRPVKTYSSGMMMRLAFAVQVLCEPEILIIDEALSVGDFFFQQKCLSYIRTLCAKGVTLLFVSHDMGTVRDVCSRAIYLRNGSVEKDGDSARVVSYYFVRNDQQDTPNSVERVESSLPGKLNPPVAGLIMPLWQTDKDLDSVSSPSLFQVALHDENDLNVSSIRIGCSVTLKVIFKSFGSDTETISVGIVNKYGQLVTCFNSNKLISAGVTTIGLKQFNFTLPMLLESGKYSIVVTLGYKTGPNSGGTFDQTPNLGPISVFWNYQEDEAPFVGMFGLPVEVGSVEL
ncbi:MULTISPECIES: ABC transporter ATP-binding protein [unclassified Methylophilus]|uniref:ABC transporter ATP-binding protein n=1 Tax=unclassified Methylophilus TaxID=2630143 RepID=UPI0028D37E48|nr:ABC transporter ATP-binding protein [Methylophilus sp. VKM B-3414]BEV06956.1 ABC transporter ATP-binding protein [Methylophilus sp. DW102]